TTFKIGGPADFYFEPADAGDLAVLVNLLEENEFPFVMIGNGSNILVSDFGYRGAAINLERGLSDFEFDGELVRAGAGAKLAKFVDLCIENGLHGVEMLAGIPGTLGGAIVMNAGAYGGAISDYLVEAEVIRKGELKKVPREAAVFGYRYSSFQDDIMVTAKFKFPNGDKSEMRRVRRELMLRRNEAQPVELPNAGSIFKNPVMNSAGRLIENCGLKGFRIGNAEISQKHANFIVNLGGASAVDVLRLIRKAQEVVLANFDVILELEVRLIGVFSEDNLADPYESGANFRGSGQSPRLVKVHSAEKLTGGEG
ncbi:MAG: UDP-N-acetylmuramate dehydrogenase, partial [Candidatus Kryptoniota bacterium]